MIAIDVSDTDILGSEFMLEMVDDKGPGHVHTLVL